jgi:DNA-binding LacI/PurR family transcriptional regulator
LASDTLAALRRARVDIPGKVALLSLEDDPRFLHENISVVAPDWDRAGYLMAHALLGDLTLERTHRGFVRLPVPLVTRLTTPRQ